MHKKIYSVVLFAMFTGAISTAGAQASEEEAVEVVTTEAVPQKPDCNRFAFGKGCMGFGFGPVFTSDGKDLVYGLAAGFSYFMVDRLALGVNGGAVFGNGYQDYSTGPALTYYIGPFAGYLITPSYSATRHYLRGSINAEGWAYGPSIGIMTRFFGRAYWGISVGYYTYEVAGYKSSDWNWSPVVFIPF